MKMKHGDLEVDLIQAFKWKDELNLSPLVKAFIAGSFSGTVSTVLFQPLDLVKTRLQSGNASAIHGSRGASLGSIGLVARIIQKEHLSGLWRGIVPSVARCVPGVGLYFASLHWLKGIALEKEGARGGEPGPLEAVLLGVAARTVSGVCLIPMTVVKTRFESGQYGYSSIVQAVAQIYRQEGVRGLSCGLLPTLVRDAPFSGLYLMFYTQLKASVPRELPSSSELQSVSHFSCGVLAGILASAVTQPADVIKTKMQLYPDRFSSVVEVVFFVHKKYGIQGYFKGLGPRMLRRTLMAALAWTLYEKVTVSMGLK